MTMSTFKIIKVDTQVPAIASHLEAMHHVCFPDFPLPGWHGDWWFAMDTDKVPAAFCGLWPSVRFPGAGYLCRAGVMPVARGKGLQRRMIRIRENAARRKGWDALYTDADAANPASINNLFASGYRAFSPPVLWDGEGFVYFRKIISEGVA